MRTILEGLQQLGPWEWPDNASAMIQNVLTDETSPVEVRMLAVRLAGETVVLNDEMADTLLAVCVNADESDELRGQAASSLGVALADVDMEGGYDGCFDFDDDNELCISEPVFKTVQTAFRMLWEDDESPELVRRRALEASVRYNQDWHYDAVKKAWASPIGNMRLTAVFCMRSISDFDAEILEALSCDDPWVQIHAVQAAGNWEIKKAWKTVAAILDNGNPGGEFSDPKKALYLAAIEGISGFLSAAKTRDLLKAFIEDSDADVSATAEEALIMVEPTGWDEDEW